MRLLRSRVRWLHPTHRRRTEFEATQVEICVGLRVDKLAVYGHRRSEGIKSGSGESGANWSGLELDGIATGLGQ